MRKDEIVPGRTYVGPPGSACRHVLRIATLDGWVDLRVVYEDLGKPLWSRTRNVSTTAFARWATGVIE